MSKHILPRGPNDLAKIKKQMRLEDRALVTTLLALSAVAVIALILQFGGHASGLLIGALFVAMAIALVAGVVWGIASIRTGRSLDQLDPAGRAPRRPVWAYVAPLGAGLLVGGFYWFIPSWRSWTWAVFVFAGFGIWAWVSIRRQGGSSRH